MLNKETLIKDYLDYKDKCLLFGIEIEPLSVGNYKYSVLRNNELELDGLHVLDSTIEIPEIFEVYNFEIEDKEKRIESFKVKNNVIIKRPVFCDTNIGEVYMDNVKVIDSNLFEISRIAKFYGKNVRHIGKFAFKDCLNLVEVNTKRVTTLSEGCFSGCISLKSVIFQQVLLLSFNCFKDCTSLESVRFGRNGVGVTSIPRGSFQNTLNLKSVSGTQIVKLVGECAFRNSGIEKIDIRNATSIEDYCFNRSGLNHIILSRELKNVGFNAFNNLQGQLYVTFIGNESQFNQINIRKGNMALKNAVINYV